MKLLASLVASMFAVSAYAADPAKPAEKKAEAKPAATAPAKPAEKKAETAKSEAAKPADKKAEAAKK